MCISGSPLGKGEGEGMRSVHTQIQQRRLERRYRTAMAPASEPGYRWGAAVPTDNPDGELDWSVSVLLGGRRATADLQDEQNDEQRRR